METELIKETNKTFEEIKHIDDDGNEFWFGRELMSALGYSFWENFCNAINKAIISCNISKASVYDHFREVTKIVTAGVASKPVKDYILTRYACYLIAQNADESKKEVALAQSYFATQTRKQELFEEKYNQLSEDEKRLYSRNLAKEKNSALFEVAQQSGVENFGKFNNAGYLGLYNETAQQIKSRKNLDKKQDILDYMGSEELGANIFRITQTEAKLKKSNISNEDFACSTHNRVGKAVRRAIEEVGGTMPEDLPTPKKGIKEIQKEKKKQARLENKKEKELLGSSSK